MKTLFYFILSLILMSSCILFKPTIALFESGTIEYNSIKALFIIVFVIGFCMFIMVLENVRKSLFKWLDEHEKR